jgi:hypothetical protein
MLRGTGSRRDAWQIRTNVVQCAVEVAREDGSWTRLAAEVVVDGPLVWAGTHVLRDGVERVLLRFAPIRTAAVRLVQTGEDPVYDWSVAELHLVGP